MIWRRLRLFLELIRFSHTVFALPFALLSALMAWLGPDAPPWRWPDLAGIVLCMVFARSAAMAFNRLADRRFDALNPRTRMRHLPAGLLTPAAVALFTVASGLGFLASTLLFLPNRWPIMLALPVLAFVCAYSFTKRFTSLSHFWLGAALMLAPLAAWIAIRGGLDWPPVVLGAAVLLWVAGFDIIYACQDHPVDVQLGLHSLPAALGVARALRVAAMCHLGTIAALLLLPQTYPALGSIYYAGVLGVAALLAYEHYLVRPDDLARVNLAFFHVNAVISLGLLAVATLDLLW